MSAIVFLECYNVRNWKCTVHTAKENEVRTMKQNRKTIIFTLLLSLLLTMVMGILPAGAAPAQEESVVEKEPLDSFRDPIELSSY